MQSFPHVLTRTTFSLVAFEVLLLMHTEIKKIRRRKGRRKSTLLKWTGQPRKAKVNLFLRVYYHH